MKEVLIHYWQCDYCDATFQEKWKCEAHEITKHKCPICVHSYHACNSEFGNDIMGCEREDQKKLCKFEKKEN